MTSKTVQHPSEPVIQPRRGPPADAAAAPQVDRGLDLSSLTGAGIHVGIVDSGCGPGSPYRLGHGVDLVAGTQGTQAPDTAGAHVDLIGHGTACAGIVSRKAPEAVVQPVRVFDEELVADVTMLCAALEWCAENGVQIANLSLGTTAPGAREQLDSALARAAAAGVVVVAAAANDGTRSYPACLTGAFGVDAGKVYGRYDYYFRPDREVQFIAHGDRQRLDWRDGGRVFLGGTSFAAPHVTGIIALLLQQHPGITHDELTRLLVAHSVRQEPDPVAGQARRYTSVLAPAKRQPVQSLRALHGQSDIHWIGRALLYPYNKEMHDLVRFRDMLPFQLSHVVDEARSGWLGRDAGRAIGAAAADIPVTRNLRACLDDTDTLLLGYLDGISRVRKCDMLRQMLQLALQHGKNVYSLSAVTAETHPALHAEFRRQGLRLGCPLVTATDFERITQAFDWRIPSSKPVVGVFGTGPQQGEFTVQLALRQQLRQVGYEVAQLGTQHQAPLFGFDFTFPNGYGSPKSVLVPMELHVSLVEAALVGMESEDPDLIVVGGQSGLAPHSCLQNAPRYALPSVLLLMAAAPDAVILVVDAGDDDALVERNLELVRGLTTAEVAMLAYSDTARSAVHPGALSSVADSRLSPGQLQELEHRLEDTHGVPATHVVSAAGREKMVKVLQERLAAGS